MIDRLSGRLFVFEGPDDVGKTTLAEMLSDYLSVNGRHNQLLSFPGREPGTVSELVYRLYHDPISLGVDEITPIAMQVMVTAAHIEVIEARIKPLLTSGIDIVLDRFWWSTWVYARLEGVSEETSDVMIKLEMQSWDTIRPDRIFFVLRRNPLLPQPNEPRWSKVVELYKQLVELEITHSPIHLVENEGSSSRALDRIVSKIPR